MAKTTIPPAARLRDLLTYDPDTGLLHWRIARPPRIKAGRLAGYIHQKYRVVCVDNIQYLAHHLIWTLMTGDWPTMDIDHVDGDGTNNRWSNLRLATPQQNAQNRKPRKSNISGIRGVTWYKPYSRWVVNISGKHFGYFDDREEARKVRDREAKRLHGRFYRKSD